MFKRLSVAIASVVVLLSGCTTFGPPPSCEQFDAQSKKTNYATQYNLKGNDTTSLQKNELAKTATYEITLDSEKVWPCSHVAIKKDLTLARSDNKNLIFEETREFFAANGARIVAKNETLTEQLKKSGRYQATILLPIPKGAPPGKYRIVSTLNVKTPGKAATVIGKSSATFEVLAVK